jgi:hydroxypyruvate isomerase
MPKFAANLTLLFTEVPFLDRFALAHEHGFKAVEFLFPYAFEAEQIQRRLVRYGLDLALFNLPPGNWNEGDRGLACDPRRMGEFRDSVELGLEYALELGAKRVHCMAGLLAPQLSLERAQATYLDNLRHVAERFGPHGIDVLIEPINRHDMPGYLLQGSAQAVEVLDACGLPNLRLQYDVYHMQRSEGELALTLERLLPRIGHIQIADTPGRHEPGTGEINYPFLFRWLDRIGYSGWVGCEYHPSGTSTDSFAWCPGR